MGMLNIALSSTWGLGRADEEEFRTCGLAPLAQWVGRYHSPDELHRSKHRKTLAKNKTTYTLFLAVPSSLR